MFILIYLLVWEFYWQVILRWKFIEKKYKLTFKQQPWTWLLINHPSAKSISQSALIMKMLLMMSPCTSPQSGNHRKWTNLVSCKWWRDILKENTWSLLPWIPAANHKERLSLLVWSGSREIKGETLFKFIDTIHDWLSLAVLNYFGELISPDSKVVFYPFTLFIQKR